MRIWLLFLSDNLHLFEESVVLGQLIYSKQDKSHIQRDVSAYIRIKHHITHSSLPHSIKVQTDQISIAIYYRAAGVAA